MTYTKDSVATLLRQFRAEHHRFPSRRDLNPPPEGYPWYQTICRIFGNFQAALNYAFPDYQALLAADRQQAQRQHAKQMRSQLKQEYWQKFLELGYPPTIDQVNADPTMHSQSAYQRYWGGLGPLLAALDLTEAYNCPRSDGQGYTEEYLLRALQDKYRRDQTVPTYNGVTADWRTPCGQTYLRHFRCSWDQILRRAHIRPSAANLAHRGLSDAYLLEVLRRKARLLGATPTSKQVTKDASMPSAKVYADHFGSYYQALLAAGLQPTAAQTHSHRAALTRQATKPS